MTATEVLSGSWEGTSSNRASLLYANEAEGPQEDASPLPVRKGLSTINAQREGVYSPPPPRSKRTHGVSGETLAARSSQIPTVSAVPGTSLFLSVQIFCWAGI